MNVKWLAGILVLAVCLGAERTSAQTSSIGARARKVKAADPPRKASREEPEIERNLVYERYSWTAAPPKLPKTFKVNDLVTIIVRERLQFEADADLETKKNFDIKSQVNAFVKLDDNRLGATTFLRGQPNIDYKYANKYKTEADTSRQDKLTTRITGKIIDVKPNGLLVIEARRLVQHDDEISGITLTGTCRKEDVTADNTVLSTQLADKEVIVNNEGALRANSSRGWIPKLLDLLKPF